MLTDPQSITVNGVAISLPRTSEVGNYADYTASNDSASLRILQSKSGKTRRTAVVFRQNKIAADPLTAINQRIASQVSITFTSPIDGFTITELANQFLGLSSALSASSAANLVKILGGEK